MSSAIENQYKPDYVSLPGETLLDVLKERGMTQAELVERTGGLEKTINEVITGITTITPEIAIRLERALGVPAQFWLERERQYRESLTRKEEGLELYENGLL